MNLHEFNSASTAAELAALPRLWCSTVRSSVATILMDIGNASWSTKKRVVEVHVREIVK
jgi:hypothetical protein